MIAGGVRALWGARRCRFRLSVSPKVSFSNDGRPEATVSYRKGLASRTGVEPVSPP